MPDHIRGAQADRERTNNPSKSHLASMIRWLQIKKYQYEVTFSLYMLTPTEKIVFNAIILTIFSLLIAAAVCYLPNHIAIVSNRLWYYVHGEFLVPTDGSAAAASKKEMRRLVTDAITRSGSAAAARATGTGEL